MSRIREILFVLCLAMALIACQFVTQQLGPAQDTASPMPPTAPPTSAQPTIQPTDAVSTNQPTETTPPSPPPPEMPTQENPPPTESGPQATIPATWKDIPIMPGATQGSDEEVVYSYKIKATIAEVQAFYEKEMGKLGWMPFATSSGEADSLVLMYQKGSQMVTIAATNMDGLVWVVISVM